MDISYTCSRRASYIFLGVCGEIELSATSFPCCRISHPLVKQGETPVFKPERVTVSPEALASPFIS